MEIDMSLIRTVFTLALGATFSFPALAAEMATGDQIKAAISGNTVQGEMIASGAYTEHYAADGVIKGKDYKGAWSVEADTMCFQYGTDPKGCWQVRIEGEKVAWVKDGKDDGTGTIVAGNPYNF